MKEWDRREEKVREGKRREEERVVNKHRRIALIQFLGKKSLLEKLITGGTI